MKKIFTICFLISFINLSVFSQKEESKPDFTGTWILDTENSVATVDLDLNYELVISQMDSELKIIQKSAINKKKKNRSLLLFTDKRGETNIYLNETHNKQVESKTFWEGDSLIRKYDITSTLIRNLDKARSGKYIPKAEAVDKYVLSKDKQTLTLTVTKYVPITFPQPLGTLTERTTQKYVYKKK